MHAFPAPVLPQGWQPAPANSEAQAALHALFVCNTLIACDTAVRRFADGSAVLFAPDALGSVTLPWPVCGEGDAPTPHHAHAALHALAKRNARFCWSAFGTEHCMPPDLVAHAQAAATAGTTLTVHAFERTLSNFDAGWQLFGPLVQPDGTTDGPRLLLALQWQEGNWRHAAAKPDLLAFVERMTARLERALLNLVPTPEWAPYAGARWTEWKDIHAETSTLSRHRLAQKTSLPVPVPPPTAHAVMNARAWLARNDPQGEHHA